jgi:hypothetical protein
MIGRGNVYFFAGLLVGILKEALAQVNYGSLCYKPSNDYRDCAHCTLYGSVEGIFDPVCTNATSHFCVTVLPYRLGSPLPLFHSIIFPCAS